MSSSVSADLPGTRDVGMFLGSEFPMDQQTLLCRDNSLSLFVSFVFTQGDNFLTFT